MSTADGSEFLSKKKKKTLTWVKTDMSENYLKSWNWLYWSQRGMNAYLPGCCDVFWMGWVSGRLRGAERAEGSPQGWRAKVWIEAYDLAFMACLLCWARSSVEFIINQDQRIANLKQTKEPTPEEPFLLLLFILKAIIFFNFPSVLHSLPKMVFTIDI